MGKGPTGLRNTKGVLYSVLLLLSLQSLILSADTARIGAEDADDAVKYPTTLDVPHADTRASRRKSLHLLSSTTAVTNSTRRIIGIGDIDGDLPKLQKTLADANVIDRDGHWRTDCAATVVQVGNLGNFGPHYYEIYDYAAQLEREANAAGGEFIFLIGDHELGLLTGEFYVYKKLVRRDFGSMMRFAESFSPRGLYGRFLLQHNVVVVKENIVFVHGGLNDALALHGVRAINKAFRRGFYLPEEAHQTTEALPDSIQRRNTKRQPLPTYKHSFSSEESPIMDTELTLGALRGDCDAVHDALDALSRRLRRQVTTMVVGHVSMPSGAISVLCDGALLAIDVKLSRFVNDGDHAAYVEWVPEIRHSAITADIAGYVANPTAGVMYKPLLKYPLGKGRRAHGLWAPREPMEMPRFAFMDSTNVQQQQPMHARLEGAMNWSVHASHTPEVEEPHVAPAVQRGRRKALPAGEATDSRKRGVRPVFRFVLFILGLFACATSLVCLRKNPWCARLRRAVLSPFICELRERRMW